MTGCSLNPDNLVLSYDHPRGTFLGFFQECEQRSVVVGGTDHRFMLVDPETNDLVGLQIEDFLARAVLEEPGLIELLDYAELRGITPDDVRRERRNALGQGHHLAGQTETESRPGRPASNRKQELVRALLNDEQLGLPNGWSRGAA